MNPVRPIRDEHKLDHLRKLVLAATEQRRWYGEPARDDLNLDWLAERGWRVAPVDWSARVCPFHVAETLRRLGIAEVMAARLDDYLIYSESDIQKLREWEEELKKMEESGVQFGEPPSMEPVECEVTGEALVEIDSHFCGLDFVVLDQRPRFIYTHGEAYDLYAGSRDTVERILGKSIKDAVEDYLAVNRLDERSYEVARRVVDRYRRFF